MNRKHYIILQITRLMARWLKLLPLLLAPLLFNGCGVYNFTGGDVGTATTYQVNYFQNYATQSPGSTFDPGLDREFTLSLQDLILSQRRSLRDIDDVDSKQ